MGLRTICRVVHRLTWRPKPERERLVLEPVGYTFWSYLGVTSSSKLAFVTKAQNVLYYLIYL